MIWRNMFSLSQDFDLFNNNLKDTLGILSSHPCSREQHQVLLDCVIDRVEAFAMVFFDGAHIVHGKMARWLNRNVKRWWMSSPSDIAPMNDVFIHAIRVRFVEIPNELSQENKALFSWGLESLSLYLWENVHDRFGLP